MAFIATYISTTSVSELSTWYSEIDEESTTVHENIIKESFDWVNERIDTTIPLPIRTEYTTGRYHSTLRHAQAMAAIWKLRGRNLGWENKEVKECLSEANKAIEDIIKNKAHFEEMYSQDEIGTGRAIPATANTSTGKILTDRRRDYTGDREQTYTITITTAGAVGTAIFSWSDGEGNTTTAVTTDYDWIGLDNNVYIRFMDSGDNFVINNTWTIRCVPTTEIVSQGVGLSMIEIRK